MATTPTYRRAPQPPADFSEAEARYAELLKDPNLRLIRLTKGEVTIVNASCYENLCNGNWRANWSHGAGKYYAVRNVGKRKIYMHCDIMGLYKSGPLPKSRNWVVDHKNGDPLDNRVCNLQIIPRKKDALKRKTPRTNTTGYRCIRRRKRVNGCAFTADIRRDDGSREHLGTLKTLPDAFATRRKAVNETGDPCQREYGLIYGLIVLTPLYMLQRAHEVLPVLKVFLHHA